MSRVDREVLPESPGAPAACRGDGRRRGLAQRLLSEVDKLHPHEVKELYTCTKSLINIRLYEKMGYVPYAEHAEESGLSFVHMRKC